MQHIWNKHLHYIKFRRVRLIHLGYKVTAWSTKPLITQANRPNGQLSTCHTVTS